MFLLLCMAFSATAALARAGGGEGYGGGGGFGGGDDGGGLFSLWPLLFLGHGSGSIFLVAIILYYVYRQMQARGGPPYTRPTNYGADVGYVPTSVTSVSAPPRTVDQQSISDALAAIQKRDPNFSEAVFLDRAQTAFFKVQQAWAARNQDLARDVMSEALYQRHKLQTDQLIANHRIDVLQNIVIGHARITNISPGGTYDTITVAFSASMVDYTIDEQTKQVVSGQQYATTFTEFWAFIRRADAKTSADSTALASTCPACGAPLHLTNGKCDYCGAPVRSSSNDWVVDTIEQST